ncbi:MAG: hypothetical protein WD176_06100, partial [Pirellulales bacterium]
MNDPNTLFTLWDQLAEEAGTTDAEGKPIRRRDRGKMPVGSEGRARAASKATWRSRRVSKWIARHSDG